MCRCNTLCCVRGEVVKLHFNLGPKKGSLPVPKNTYVHPQCFTEYPPSTFMASSVYLNAHLRVKRLHWRSHVEQRCDLLHTLGLHHFAPVGRDGYSNVAAQQIISRHIDGVQRSHPLWASKWNKSSSFKGRNSSQ